MRRGFKVSELEEKLPILAVEKDCLVSKYGDVTVAFAVQLPEVYTLSREDYSILHSNWVKAIRLLPSFSILHKQDWFIRETYSPDREPEDFLSRSFEQHFSQRPYLNHTCYLFITRSSPDRMKVTSLYTSLARGSMIPRDVNPNTLGEFLDAVGQFQSVMNDSGYVKLSRLSTDEIVGTGEQAGILEKYLSVSMESAPCLEDIDFREGLKIGHKHFSLFTISGLDDLPHKVATDVRYEDYSTDKTSFRVGFASPVGLHLNCNHLYNQYIFLDDHTATLKKFEGRARNLRSLSRYSRENAVNEAWTIEYLNEAVATGKRPVRCHCNLFVWSENREELPAIKNLATAAIAKMDCRPRHNTTDIGMLFWAGIPGGAGDFPSEESFYTFIEQAVCLFNQETNYYNSPGVFGLKLVDRLSGKPILVDLSDEPMQKGWTTNRNKFILGPSGSGKSFFTNSLAWHYYLHGAHVVLVDIGHSYQGLCTLISEQTCGEDGIYLSYTETAPIAFNPFYVQDHLFDIEKKESIKMLILTLWKKDTAEATRAEEIALSNAVNQYIEKLRMGSLVAGFNSFYEFIRGEYRQGLSVREKDFDIENFLYVLAPYYQGGEYDYLLNSAKELDLLHKRFIVFELDNIKDHNILLPVVTLIIMETFISKMRRLKGVRKVMLIEECWKAIAREGFANYLKYLYKTVRKHFGEAIVITQEIDDIISSPVVKDTIINNADCKILLDQRKYKNKFSYIQNLLGLSEKEVEQVLSINLNNDPGRRYKEVFISLGGMRSAVYAVEVSLEEYYTYTTEQKEKVMVQQLAEDKGGDVERAIRQIANSNRNKTGKKNN